MDLHKRIMELENEIAILPQGSINIKKINGKEHNIEQLSAKILFDLTRNTGFEVSKGKIGECWIKSCCEWEERQEDDICGLDLNRLTLCEKMKKIYLETSLKAEFQSAGLEVEA